MGICEFCRKREALPFKCKFCNGSFCSEHHLPEHHDCIELELWKKTRSKDPEYWIYDPFRDKPRKKGKRKIKHHIKKEYVGKTKQYSKPDFSNRIKSNIKTKYYKIKHWLNKRNYRGYRNWNAFFMNFLWMVSLSISFLIIYSNLNNLNKIVLWFLPLGGTLLLINGFFWLKYTYKLLKRVQYWFIGERNWVRYLVIFFLLFLLWRGYQQKETVFNPMIDIYDKINSSEILPLNLNISWSNFSPFTINNATKNSNYQIKETNKPDRSSDYFCSVIQIQTNYRSSEEDSKSTIEYLNQIREKYGKKPISFDKRVYELAAARAEDMRNYSYLDHTNPYTGTCPDNMKLDFGLQPNEYVAENAHGNPQYSEGRCTEIRYKSMNKTIDSWMTSRGHRYNLLYDGHVAGAVGCYKNMCTFLGLNYDRFGEGCHTAEEGEEYWRTTPKKADEVL